MKYLLALIFLFPNFLVKAQVITTEGTEFWFGFMENHETSRIDLEVYISATEFTAGEISMPAYNWHETFSLAGDTTIMITVPLIFGMVEGSEKITAQGIHLTTDKNVTVYALNKRSRSADAAVILPVEALGKEYWVTSYKGLRPSLFAEFLIVAIEDSTEIEITPSRHTVKGNLAGIPFTIRLDKGQTYQLQSEDDLTGSHVRSTSSNVSDCKGFALFAGNEWTNIGGCGGAQDHIVEQMFPTNTWGNEFVIVPYYSRSGDLITVVAGTDSTYVHVNSTSVLLNAGEHYTALIYYPTTVVADQPISVTQFSRSQSCDNKEGDPFMIVVSPTAQMLSRVTFNALEVHVIDRYYVNIITKAQNLDLLTLDGENISGHFTDFTPNDIYAFASLNISSGNHTLASDSGFIAYVYGFGDIESFGYSAGISLDNLNLEVLSYDPASEVAVSTDTVCISEVVNLTIKGDERFVDFGWEFGDGLMANGDSVKHAFEQPGNYLVSVTASTASGYCGHQEKAAARIVVVKPQTPVNGSASVCPETPGVTYSAGSEDDRNLYHWSVIGGTILANLGDSVIVDWGTTNDHAGLNLVTTNYLGCTGDTTFFPVKINIQLDPLAPLGLDSLCSSDNQGNDYFTYKNPTSTYSWSVDGGTIAEGQGTSNIKINWNGFGTKSLSYTESSVLLDVCSGFSDTLTVFVEREPIADLSIVAPGELQLGDILHLDFLGDTLFRYMSWDYGDGQQQDSLDVSSSVSHFYHCPGMYNVYVSAYTGTLCDNTGVGQMVINVKPPEVEITSVSVTDDENIRLMWNYAGSVNYSKDIYLMRRLKGEDVWNIVHSFNFDLTRWIDDNVKVNHDTYEYQIVTNIDCDIPVSSRGHNSILLEYDSLAGEGEYVLSWNEYVNWQHGVEDYELWKSIDGKEYEVVLNSPEGSVNLEYMDEGFLICYKIRAIESAGNDARSWSNELCLEFVPEVITYNFISPSNGDKKNDRFIIHNIVHYPNSKLTIINRHGRAVYSSIGYQNDWQGEDINSGIYFFIIELNEPRNPVPSIKGTLTVFK